jgi:hypothetical protein
MYDTVGPIVVIPHTVGAMRSSVHRIVEEGVTLVSVDTRGNLMGAVFSDGSAGLYWYRSPNYGSTFGLTPESFHAS